MNFLAYKFFCLIIICSFFLGNECAALSVDSLSTFQRLSPCEKKTVSINITNDRDVPEVVLFKLSDYAHQCDGLHYFEDCEKHSRSNNKWVTLSADRIVLAPRESHELQLTIEAPSKIEEVLQGSYWSVLLIEPADPIEAIDTSHAGFNLGVKIRYAYHIVTNLGKGQASLKILAQEIKTVGDQKRLCVDVLNNGTLFLNPKLSIRFYDAGGILCKSVDAQSERIYPGSSARYFMDSEGLAGKKFTAFVLLDNGDENLFGDSFQVSFE